MTNLLCAPPRLGTVLSLTGLPGGNDEIYDRSPYGNHGTITGATWKKLPSGLWYLDFDGNDDYVNCGAHSSLYITDKLTIEAWVKTSDDDGAIISARGATSNNAYQCRINGGKLSFDRYPPSGGGVDSTASANDGTWKHLAIVLDDDLTNKVTLFINGVPEIKAYTETYSGTAPTAVTIGASLTPTVEQKLAGSIALLRVTKGTLKSFQIQNHFNQEKHLFGVW